MRKTNDITRTLRRPFACFALCALALAGAMSETGCRKIVTPAQKGDNVLFSAGVGGSESGTKTAYTNSNASNRSLAENINWLSGDQIRIWCAECSEPTTDTYGNADHFADYTVTPKDGTPNKATIAVNPGTVGLRWGEPETTHHFYAIYPSPATKDSSAGIDKSSDSGSFATDAGGQFTFTGHIPQNQKIASYDASTSIAYPDMSNLYMVSKAEAKPVTETGTKADEDAVFLEFRPISTAIEFTIENAMTAEGASMQVESVKIMSDPKPESGNTAKNLAGAFIADLASTWTKPADVTAPTGSGIIGTYINKYPSCTEPADRSGQTPAVAIDFRNTTACTDGIAKGDRLQFTFFLLPTQSVDDLSFVITRKDGEGTKTIKTRLAMSDGTGIPFPVHKKTYVKGILVPDSAQWTIQYTVDVVTPWGDNPEDIPFYYPDMQEITTVTPWEEVACDPGFEKK